eukprot:GHVQ01020505.1.p1 GENE.GHVQ01020505.1~~GHVQ01020505.1.p1  ORF type:complete len:296 (-),score=24.82 GHVQ01020505.1:355-1242(-)
MVAVAQTDSKPVVVYIHGLAPKPAKKELERIWTLSLSEGGLGPNIEELEVKTVYYADLNRHPTLTDNNRPAKPTGSGGIYKPGFKRAAWGFATYASGQLVDMCRYGNWYLDGVPLATAGSVVPHFDDAERYITGENKAQVDKRLQEVLDTCGNRPVCILAHSMGTIVAYCKLRELHKQDGHLGNIKHLVTMGSPLGFPTVTNFLYRMFQNEFTSLQGLTWLNISAKADIVSIDPYLDDDLPDVIEDVRIYNDVEFNENEEGSYNDPHAIEGYLRSRPCQDAVRAFLELYASVRRA